MTGVRVVAGILLLIAGAGFPVAMLFRMNSMLNSKPAPLPGQVGMLLALNGLLPLALITAGLTLLSARSAASPGLRAAMLATGLASAVLMIALAISEVAARRRRRDDGG